jgi:transposase
MHFYSGPPMHFLSGVDTRERSRACGPRRSTEGGGPRGYDAGKKIKGRKRHILTDTGGLLVGAIVHEAGVQDRDGAPSLLAALRYAFPWLRHVFADGGYAGGKLETALKRLGKWTIEIVKRALTRFSPHQTPLGRRAHLRLAQPQSPTGKGLRDLDRERFGLAYDRQCQTSHSPHRPSMIIPNYESDSKDSNLNVLSLMRSRIAPKFDTNSLPFGCLCHYSNRGLLILFITNFIPLPM